MKVILGVDGGNDRVKLVGDFGAFSFYSNICEWFERDTEEQFGADDMEFIINGRRGYAGSIARAEDEFGGGNMMGDTKAHEDAKIRILLGLHRFCNSGDEIYLVTGQPIIKHKQNEKEKIKKMLVGRHDVKVNGKSKILFIEGVEVAPEGSAAFWARPLPGKVRVLDIGSGTVNAATLLDKKHITTQSTTFNFGIETVSNKNYENIARGIIKNASKKWAPDDTVLICGGAAEPLAPFIQQHFKNAQILYPSIPSIHGKTYKPIYANAVGFYELAKRRFK